MSKTERRKLFQPIPLSSILDPTYKSPFSKLEKFQVDMDIPSKFPQQSVWQKLQSSLLNAMSNFVIMSHPVFASSTTSVATMSHRSTHMSLVPWKSFKPCELLISEEIVDSMPKSASLPTTPIKSVPEKSTSLYHSVRSGLQCLRYLATHPLQPEEDEHKQSAQTQTPTRHYYDCRKQNNNIVLPAVGFPIVGGGGALCFPLILSSTECTSRYSLSAPASPTHHHYQHQTWRPVVSNLFSWAMSGFLLATPLQHRHFDSLYKNYCLFSPVHGKGTEINTTMLCPQKLSGNVENLSSSCKTKAEGNIEIFIHSSSATAATSHDSKSGKDLTINCASSASQTKTMSVANSPTKTNSSAAANNNSGCIRIETNWMAVNDESSSRTNFHTMSVCSSTSSLKGGTLTFSCSSVSSSPRAMMSAARAIPKRFKTESESSTDSFVEFSASVESTDSFCIVFESAPGCIDEEGDPREIDDEEWEDDDDEDDDSDDDDDQIFNYSGTSDDIFVDGYIFEADGIDLGGPTSCDQVDLCVPNKQHKKKTVSFDEEHLELIVEFEDDAESKSSRETYWEMLARDRTRFQDRILRTGDILESILQPAHRLQVYNQRFVKTQESQLN